MAARKARTPAASLDKAQQLWLLACAFLALLPAAEHVPLWLTGVAGLALAWRVILWWQGLPLPPRWLLTFLVLAGTAGVFITYRQLFGKDPGVALLVLFMVLKLLELRSTRDALTVVLLSYFLLLTHFLETQSIGFAGLSLLALIVATAAMASLARRGGTVAAHLRLSMLMLAQAAPFMLVLFLLFPRVQGPLWGMPVDAYSGMSGLSDTMSPGSIGNLSLSGEIAFRVQFDGAIPPRQALYWRGPVLRFFDGRTWHAGVPQIMPSRELPHAVSGPAIAYTLTLEPHNKPWLFALEMPGTLPANAIITSESQMLARMPIRSRLRYALLSHPEYSLGGSNSADSFKPLLQLPDGNPKTRVLMSQWRKEAGGDEALIRRLLAHFRQESFFYTLTPPLLGEHGVDEFLFGTRRGFCEHFASAFVFAMRAAGIPARVVTGYQGGEHNPVDGYFIVRQSDTHAWAEVWLPQRGWLRVDPTAAVAPNRIETGLATAVGTGEPLPFMVRADLDWLRALRFRWEALSNSWNQWVLGYTPERQRELLSRLGMIEPDWQAMTAAMGTLCGLLLLGLMAWALRKRATRDPLLRAWERLSGKLSRIGLARHAWEGPADYAHRVAAAQPVLAKPVADIAALYIALRYGRAGSREAADRLNRMIALLKVPTRT